MDRLPLQADDQYPYPPLSSLSLPARFATSNVAFARGHTRSWRDVDVLRIEVHHITPPPPALLKLSYFGQHFRPPGPRGGTAQAYIDFAFPGSNTRLFATSFPEIPGFGGTNCFVH
jgi:hypothetical protein